jgi:hypothetical protein
MVAACTRQGYRETAVVLDVDGVDRGDDPESYNRERQKIKPVESFIQFITEHPQSKP